jgi:hypothetical protein
MSALLACTLDSLQIMLFYDRNMCHSSQRRSALMDDHFKLKPFTVWDEEPTQDIRKRG